MDKVKTKVLRLFTVIASMFLVIAPAFMSNTGDTIEAANVTSSMVDSITTNIASAKPGQKVTFHLHFSGKKDYPVKAGDTIQINFPQATDDGAGIEGIPHTQPLIYHNPDNPNDPDNGKDMGTVTVTKTGVTITFNQTAAGLKTIEGGDFTFSGIVVKKQGTNPTHTNPFPDSQNIPTPTISVGQTSQSTSGTGQPGGVPNVVAPTGTIKKSGAIDPTNGNIEWQIHGTLGNSDGNTTVTDSAKDGQQIVPGSIQITFFGQHADGTWSTMRDVETPTSLQQSGMGSVTTTSNGFTLTVNNPKVA